MRPGTAVVDWRALGSRNGAAGLPQLISGMVHEESLVSEDSFKTCVTCCSCCSAVWCNSYPAWASLASTVAVVVEAVLAAVVLSGAAAVAVAAGSSFSMFLVGSSASGARSPWSGSELRGVSGSPGMGSDDIRTSHGASLGRSFPGFFFFFFLFIHTRM
jgi:hypothetical protein